ncbi:SPFH domain-containing protein [Alkalimonas amylolytica]|uniref:Regulator of protease activity HflC, stomatin/prohibitin superfamily n=1 Tax=Alkalimonas amylolytica TaxID=152573 RepID=A0A1H4FM31_ALKAM|nr:stomatin-like protein [Alkalimonas amylolytica]SEA63213.1 Regulator of protease activity HflC, stomatin/prohibitin superfamily [Alkalimonas amylolytica]SEA97562.1 Regulator of protease activity HflC, stomatin/prohibitin superfamily [Alkalimonas amylolytica]
MDLALILLLGVAGFAIILILNNIFIVRNSECMVIERLGTYNRTLQSGIQITVPFIEKPRPIIMLRNLKFVETPRIDLREAVLDFPGQSVITKDNVTVTINGVLYFRIMDPVRAVYEVENIIQAVEVLAKTSLRAEIGRMELDSIFESREEINERLRLVLDDAGNGWGIKVVRVELLDIAPPVDVEEAMRKQMTAERQRRATVTEAEGEKQAAIARAQGEREAAILSAQGEKEAAILRAQGQRKAIEEVLSSGDGRLSSDTVIGYLLGREYLQTLPNIAKEGDRIFLPIETSNVLGSVGAIQELLSGKKF